MAWVAGCTWQGPATDILTQRLTWFDFAGAGDIRRSCDAAARDHYRLIHVADFDRQVRNYDLAVGPSGQGRLLQMIDRGVVLAPDMTSIGQVFGPTVVDQLVPATDVATLDRQLVADGLVPDGPDWTPPVGRQLQARQHFWLVAACRNGRFSLSGLADSEGAFDSIGTDEVLQRLDATGIAWPTWQPALDAASPGACESLRRRGERSVCFTLQVGENSLIGRTDQ